MSLCQNVFNSVLNDAVAVVALLVLLNNIFESLAIDANKLKFDSVLAI